MKQSKSAPWHGESRRSGLHTKFKKRNIERFRVIKSINERRDRRSQRLQQYGEHDAYATDLDT